MTPILFEYPRNAAYGRPIPKNKIYAHANPSRALKELFVRQVEQIVWQFKLAPETINMQATPAVPEIQIFSIHLKDGALDNEILRCIDRATPIPIIFELHFDGSIKSVGAYKRPGCEGSIKCHIGDYFESAWLSKDALRMQLPVVLNLEVLYAHLLSPLIPFAARPGEALAARVERIGNIRAKEAEIQRCEARLRKEKQFNRKVEINVELNKLKREHEVLIGPTNSD